MPSEGGGTGDGWNGRENSSKSVLTTLIYIKRAGIGFARYRGLPRGGVRKDKEALFIPFLRRGLAVWRLVVFDEDQKRKK